MGASVLLWESQRVLLLLCPTGCSGAVGEQKEAERLVFSARPEPPGKGAPSRPVLLPAAVAFVVEIVKIVDAAVRRSFSIGVKREHPVLTSSYEVAG
jgi:hypothetical protein